MKIIATVAVVTLSLFVNIAPAEAQKRYPCDPDASNAAMRECYTKEQIRVNAQADSLAREIASKFRKNAQDTALDQDIGAMLLKAASAVTQSQVSWKAYRDQHCEAVRYKWTSGSGAGTAYQSCMYEVGRARVQELRTAFQSD